MAHRANKMKRMPSCAIKKKGQLHSPVQYAGLWHMHIADPSCLITFCHKLLNVNNIL